MFSVMPPQCTGVVIHLDRARNANNASNSGGIDKWHGSWL